MVCFEVVHDAWDLDVWTRGVRDAGKRGDVDLCGAAEELEFMITFWRGGTSFGGLLSASSDLASSELLSLSLSLSLNRPKDTLSTTGETLMTDASSSSYVLRSPPPSLTL